jgi:hypothetical protein
MGLDITAYQKVELVEAMPFAVLKARGFQHRFYDSFDHVYLCNELHFADRSDDLAEGFYLHTAGKSLGFRAGSYGGYNQWRAALADMVGTPCVDVWKDPKPGPFVELINFSDCDGFIGPKTAAKLARDFEEHASKAGTAGNFAESYGEWSRAFALAAIGGVVKFH